MSLYFFYISDCLDNWLTLSLILPVIFTRVPKFNLEPRPLTSHDPSQRIRPRARTRVEATRDGIEDSNRSTRSNGEGRRWRKGNHPRQIDQ